MDSGVSSLSVLPQVRRNLSIGADVSLREKCDVIFYFAGPHNALRDIGECRRQRVSGNGCREFLAFP
jgi:hypothetical protein